MSHSAQIPELRKQELPTKRLEMRPIARLGLIKGNPE